jgi:hypothetical protein
MSMNYFLKGFVLICFLLCSQSKVLAQEQFLRISDIPCYTKSGNLLLNPWVGGFNNPQFSSFDFNGDGLMDLFVFDRLGAQGMVFLRNQEGQFQYSTEWSHQLPQFPQIRNFALVRDFNKDGIPDIFTYHSEGSFGIKILKGSIDASGDFTFTPIVFGHSGLPVLDFFDPGFGFRRITVPSTDIPVIDDINGDGYLDILSFDSEGLYVRFFKNRGAEEGFGHDTLAFVLEDRCWGKFFESPINDQVTLSPDPNLCPLGLEGGTEIRHPGATMSVIEGVSGLKDLLLSDINLRNLKYLKNGGNPNGAWMVDQTVHFPPDFPVDLPVFPASFTVQVDSDGTQDLLISPNISGFVEDVQVVWHYKNNQNLDPKERYEFQRDDFLAHTLLDFGTRSMPVFADVTGNGLLDIVVGVQTRFDPDRPDQYSPRLSLLKNVGSKENPEYIFDQEDWLGLGQLGLNSHSFVPCFGDLDNDGDLDLIIGDNFGKLYYLENLAGPSAPMEFAPPVYNAFGISTGSFAAPTLWDFNGDGKLDLLIGERLGKMTLFLNQSAAGTIEFSSSPLNEPNGFSGIDVRIPGSGPNFAAPRVYATDRGEVMLIGRRFGGLALYAPTGSDGLYSLAEDNYGKLSVGEFIGLDLGDINGDGRLEMIVGNARGGITFFQTSLLDAKVSSTRIESNDQVHVLIYPNPAFGRLQIDCSDFVKSGKGSWHLFSPSGIPLFNGEVDALRPLVALDVTGLAAGVYIFEIMLGSEWLRKKIIVP